MKLPGLNDESKWILLRRKDNQRRYRNEILTCLIEANAY